MANRITPVEAARQLGVRPQLVYGMIKHGRLRTYNNPDGKTALVELAEVKGALGNVRHHRPKDEQGRTTVPQGVRKGTLLSYHGHMPTERAPKPHRVVAVQEVVKGEDGEPALVRTVRGDGELAVVYEVGRLAEALSKNRCSIEAPGNVLGVVMYHWVHSEQPELAASLQLWCEANGVEFATVQE